MMIARASAGTLTPSLTVIVTFTSEARGSIASILPTGTPTTRTSSPRVEADRRGEVGDHLVTAA